MAEESEVAPEVLTDVVVPGRAHDRSRRISGIRFDPKELSWQLKWFYLRAARGWRQ
jgi:hypothetical protein